MKYLSPHISWDEATYTDTGFENEPNYDQVQNMKELAFNVFEPLRIHFRKPIKITSFFRNELVNKKVGGAENSQHMAINGAAMDIIIIDDEVTNEDLFNYIKNNLPYDQLINEYNFTWVHVSYNKNNNRFQTLKIG